MNTIDNMKDDIKYYVPFCRENGCNGHLKTTINEYSFCVQCTCEKNENHKSKLYFETFNKFYLQEKTFKKCFGCYKSLEKNYIYNCTECDAFYCFNCFKSDRHIQENKRKLRIIKNVCPEDNRYKLTEYCINCSKKLCPNCLRKNIENNPHRYHKIGDISDLVPSKKQINVLYKKINEKSEAFDNLIKSLDEWQLQLNKKIEQLKHNLRNEIKVIRKQFLNFNCDYNEYAYYLNFWKSFHGLDNYNNKFLKRFMETSLFEEKTWNIFNIIAFKEPIPEKIDAKKKFSTYISTIKLIDYIFNDIMLVYFNESIMLMRYNGKGKLLGNKGYEIYFPNASYFYISPDKSKVYVHSDKKNSITIFNHKDGSLQLSDEAIQLPTNDIEKIVQIDENHLILMDSTSIHLLYKINKIYSAINKVNFEYVLYDTCKINEKYLIASNAYKLTFVIIENLTKEKVIPNVDCINKINSLILIEDCVLVNCKKGIAILSIKTKEIIQYIENIDMWETNKIIKKSTDDIIYIWNSLNIVSKYIFDNYELKLIRIIDCLKNYCDSFELKSQKDMVGHNFFVDNQKLVFWIDSHYYLVDDI